MRILIKCVVAGAVICLCHYALEKYASHVLIKETEQYLEYVNT